jgi:hypothetical protein
MNATQVNSALTVAKRNLHAFSSVVTADQIIEVQKHEVMKATTQLETLGLMMEQFRPDPEDTVVGVDDIDPVLQFMDDRRLTQVRGSKVQVYSEDGKTLIKTHVGFTEALRDPDLDEPSRAGLREAIKTRSCYKGFRWATLDRLLPDDTVQDIGESSDVKTIKKGFVSMIDLSKTKIIEVFCDQKAAAENRNFQGVAPISTAIKKGSQSGGHYFVMWSDTPANLKDDFIKRGGVLPEKRVHANGRQLEKLHPITEKVVGRYSSIEDVMKDTKVARKTLMSAAETNRIVRGYKWRYVNPIP